MEQISILSYIVFIIILIIATIKDVATLNIPIKLSSIGFIVRVIELRMVLPDRILHYLALSILTIVIMLIVAYLGNMGGADCLIGTLCVFYLGIRGLWALIIAFILAIPYTLWMKIKDDEHEYPFIPYISIGVIISFLLI